MTFTKPEKLYSRLHSLRKVNTQAQFSQSMKKTIKGLFPLNLTLVETLQELLDQEFKRFQQTLSLHSRKEIVSAIEHVISQEEPTLATSGNSSATTSDVSRYTSTMQVLSTMRIQQRILKHFQSTQSQPRPKRTYGEQALWDLLEHSRTGQMQTVVGIMVANWVPDDFEVLERASLEVYYATLDESSKGHQERDRQYAIMRTRGLTRRAKDVQSRSTAELQQLESKLPSQSPITSLSSVASMRRDQTIWSSGFYDQEFLNLWFFMVDERYKSSEKLSVTVLANPSSRADHKAYILCYENSLAIRQLMIKTYSDDPANQVRKKTRKRVQISPLWFEQLPHDIQTEGESCATISLINFLINQDPTTHGATIARLYQNILSSKSCKGNYEKAAERDPFLYALHKHVLCNQKNQVGEELEEEEQKGEQGDDYQQVDSNHLIVILPFDGHVWEIDGLEAQGPLHLGACGHDWTTIALLRLQKWSNTELTTNVHVDIQAIIGSK